MKKFENAKIEAICFENSFIATSGCSASPTNNDHVMWSSVVGKDPGWMWTWSETKNDWDQYFDEAFS